MVTDQKDITKLTELGFEPCELSALEGINASEIEVAFLKDPRMINSQKLRRRINKNLMLLIISADDDSWDDRWDAINFWIGRLLEDIIFAIMARWQGKGAGTLKVIGGEKGLRDAADRRARALYAIKSALREEKKFWKARYTDTKRVNMVLAMFKEMHYGATREEALRNIGKRESSVKQYVARVRQQVLDNKFRLNRSAVDIVNIDMKRLTPKKRKSQFARSTDVRRKRH
jgi:hypothetical protein